MDVVVTRGRTGALRALRLRSRYGASLRVHTGRWTYRELKARQNSMDWDLLASRGVHLNGTGIDVQDNVVTAGVTAPTPEQAAVLRELYGPMVRLEREGPSVLLRAAAPAH